MIHTNITKNQIDKNTVETCLCVSAFALSMIMAGTGDVECFKALRVLRKRFEHDMHYGYNMAIHMSLGFLFLGGGSFTFSRSDLAIASLICALYPIFPSTASDNRYHLQALRHFYVLAIESRLLQARDIDTGEFLNLNMKVDVFLGEDDEEMRMSDGGSQSIDRHQRTKTVQITTPDIINGTIKSIEVQDERYHSVLLKFDDNSSFIGGGDKRQKIFEQFDFQKIVYIKKKIASQVTQNEQTSSYSIKDQVPIINEDIKA